MNKPTLILIAPATLADRQKTYGDVYRTMLDPSIIHTEADGGLWCDTLNPAFVAMSTWVKAEKGRRAWANLHRTTQTPEFTAEWLLKWVMGLDCGPCRDGGLLLLLTLPPVFGAGALDWSITYHNGINAKLGKPPMPLNEARTLWVATP